VEADTFEDRKNSEGYDIAGKKAQFLMILGRKERVYE